MGKNNIKYTINEIKNELLKINPDIFIIDNEYINNKTSMNCYCFICEIEFMKSWGEISKRKNGCPACGKNGVKISRQGIRDHVSKYGYSVIKFTKFDKDKGTMFIIKCPEGHQYETSYREFNREELTRHGSCKQCNQIRIGKACRKDESEVINNIEKWGYTLEDNFKYKNGREIHSFTCKNNHIRNISYYSLERVPECPECKGNPSKHTEDNIREILSEFDLEYINGYTGANEKFNFRCNCGEPTRNTLKAIRKGIRCRKCNEHKRYTIEDVREIFADENYKLLEDKYIDSKYKMKYKCNNGHEETVGLNSFLKGSRCPKCYFESVRGENSPHWNPNLTDEERIIGRKFPEYKDWRKEVFKRDYYTCQCCGDKKGGNIEAHHLNGWDWDKENRTNVHNGITLCNTCHVEFHEEYGFGGNTVEQFVEWLSEKLDDGEYVHCQNLIFESHQSNTA